ncbi:MAG: CPBP family intramembrane metalloprotease [Defluviitaleaceae bacterium]|nr:CPBP family intramembrane metalloprotease [Defluviitaleaceae bacterium]
MPQERRLTALHITIYLVVFFVIWIIRELVIQPVFLDSLNPIASELIGEGIKLLAWTVPAILLIRYFSRDMLIGLKEMFTNKLQWSRDYFVVTTAAIIFIALFVRMWIDHGELRVNPYFEPTRLIGIVLFVGITEELVFRGFLLNAFLKRMKQRYALALDAVLFALIHYPIWIRRGFGIYDIATSSISVAVLSLLFAYSFIKTRNILVPMLLHMLWNFTVYFFAG